MKLLDPIRCPDLPFAIVRYEEGYYLVNIEWKRVQLLVEATHFATQGFCIKTSSTRRDFDFHFLSLSVDDDSINYENHHHLAFREDIIQAMEKGNIPMSL